MLDTRERAATKPDPETHPARSIVGHLFVTVAGLLSFVAIAGALLGIASEEWETDIYVSLTSIPALFAVAAWVVAIVLLPMSGRITAALGSLLALLSAVAIFGAFGAENGSPGWYQVLTILGIPLWIGAMFRARKAKLRHG